ncbi:MAG: class I SAM-dependent methyltransferase [Nibricoccus sp.]
MNPHEFRKMAEVEDRMWYYRALHGHMLDALRQTCSVSNEVCVLDAGCGTGGFLRGAQKQTPNWKWSGIDFSPMACELARQRTTAEITKASITQLPFADATFDAVTTADVICQVDDPSRAFAEIYRVLKPGGIAVVNLPAYQWMLSYHDKAVNNKRRYSRDELRAYLTMAGFTVTRVTHWNALLFPMIYARRKLFSSKAGASDVKLFPASVELLFRGVMSMEKGWLRLGANWAWGAAVLAIARKP